MKFKKGDRVRYIGPKREDVCGIGVVYRQDREYLDEGAIGWWVDWDNGVYAWVSEDHLERAPHITPEGPNVIYKMGDRVKIVGETTGIYYGWEGVIVAAEVGRSVMRVQFEDDVVSLAANPACFDLTEIELIAPEKETTERKCFTVAELKDLLSRMDDSLVVELSDFRVSFK